MNHDAKRSQVSRRLDGFMGIEVLWA